MIKIKKYENFLFKKHKLPQILIEKSNSDDKYIAMLKQELDKFKTQPPVLQTKVIYRDRIIEEKKDAEVKIDKNEDKVL